MVPYNKALSRAFSVAAILQFILNLSLILLAGVLCTLLAKEISHFIQFFTLHGEVPVQNLLERILVFFLYFEFIAMIAKYFQENYHFPLRYFLYIGITAMTRLIIVHHDDPFHTFLYACVILVLIVSYCIANFTSQHRERL
ncbi:phosphate-starvation-inducible protein PsiE [Aneurinibacillus tyrosinisolvens]|jgi:protein PsiE|uniref:phosphate-starvation-inducible protein PsiE n=1 Tax=Aneurinibacillus tyrosinisolvens TaxID=1443435 RepID=UPI00063F8E6F|nr:phosphate-starvation-inducible protein PsiE [Aneurinibacillus tyrosinisolvens]